MTQKHSIQAILCILLQSVLYGFGNPLTKTAYESITPFWCLFFRFTLAFLVFAILFGSSIWKQITAARVKDYLPVSLCMALAYICCNIALSLTSATNVGFIMSLPVIFAPILSTLILKEPYNIRHLFLQLFVVVGLIMLCMNEGTIHFGIGELFALLTAIFIAGSLVFGKKSLDTHLTAITISALQAGCTAILSLVCALIFDDIQAIPKIQPTAWLVVLYLAICCTCIAYVLQNHALTLATPSLISMTQCSQPILTAVVAWFLLGEQLTLIGILGSAIILICTVLETRLQR